MREEFFAILLIGENEPTVALTDGLQAALFLRRFTAMKRAKEIGDHLGLKTKIVKVVVETEKNSKKV